MLVFLLKCQDKSKKKIYNVGILDCRWQEAHFRKKSKKENLKCQF